MSSLGYTRKGSYVGNSNLRLEGSDYRRLGCKSPCYPQGKDETPAPSVQHVTASLRWGSDGAPLSRTAREAIDVVLRAFEAGAIDAEKALKLCRQSATLQDAPVKPRRETGARRNESRIAGLEGALALSAAERAEIIARHRAKR